MSRAPPERRGQQTDRPGSAGYGPRVTSENGASTSAAEVGSTTTDQPAPRSDATESTDRLVLRFGGSLVEQLGAQLYPSVTATVAELISNAWDADARRVWVTVPFGDKWSEGSEIVVTDDGHGMTREQAQHAYLIVGRKRRLTKLGAKSEGGRFVHGRKGIGKLAAFGTAGVLDCDSLRDGIHTSFRLDYDAIRKLDPSEDYEVEDVTPTKLSDPDGVPLEHGTRVRLTRLKLKKAISQDQFLRSMSRRFSLKTGQMEVVVNTAATLDRFEIVCEFKFPLNGVPDGVDVDEDGWAVEEIDGHRVRWWIGFTEKPLGEDQQQGISVLANGKMAQRPFKFERSQGTEGQLGQEYLVGEVEADWIDHGVDIEDDLIQSNRDQLQLEDSRLESFIAWGRRRLAWALRERSDLKRSKAMSGYQASPEVDEMLGGFTKREKDRFLGVAKALSRVNDIDETAIVSTMRTVVDAQSDTAVRELMDRIEEEDDPTQERMWALVSEFGLVDARRSQSLIEARLATIRSLKKAVHNGAREVPEIHKIVLRDPWLLDPRWSLLDDEIDLTKMGIGYIPEEDEQGLRLDYLFGLAPRYPAPVDEVVVVEIKRGSDSKGTPRKAADTEVQKFHQYVLGVQDHYAASTDRPNVRGLMIAQGYTAQADRVRKSFETMQGVRLAFRTWDRVIDDTERMHLGWLAVSRERAGSASSLEPTAD